MFQRPIIYNRKIRGLELFDSRFFLFANNRAKSFNKHCLIEFVCQVASISMEDKVNYLLNRSIPFDKEKVQILDQVVDALYGKNIEHVIFFRFLSYDLICSRQSAQYSHFPFVF